MDQIVDDSQVRFSLEGDRAYITLDRPQVGNALSASMVDGINRAMDAAELAHARLIVFRGTGRHMCTGFDLSDIETSSDGDLLLRFVRIEKLLQRIFHSQVMTAAVATGRVYGAGADLFASCDRRIGTIGASFAFPGPGFGLILGTRRLSARVGVDAARRILLSGEQIALEAAARMNLVTDVCEPGAEQALLEDCGRAACRLSPATVAQIHAATVARKDAADLSALVESASSPGLRDRIIAYREKTSSAKKR